MATPVQDAEKQRAEQLIATVPLPPEIARAEVRLGSDSTGDPAMWVVLWVRSDIDFDQTIATKLNLAAEQVQEKLLGEAFPRYVYTTLDQAA